MKSIFILIIAYSTFSSNNFDNKVTETSANCSAELSVKKNRNSKSAYADGASFILTLTNTSSSTSTYSLSTTKLKEACRRSSGNSNIDLKTSILTSDSRNITNNEITLNSGQSYKFIVKVIVPEGTPYNNWGCIEVDATSKDCSSSSANTILNVFVPDPSEN